MRYLACAFSLVATLAVHGQRPELVSPAPSGFARGSQPANLTGNGRVVFFTAHDSGGRELWTTDGTRAGTRMVQDLTYEGSTFDDASTEIVFSGDQTYVSTRVNGKRRLWSTRGTAQSTVELTESLGDAFSAATFGDRSLVFADGSRLRITDGTRSGTHEISDEGGAHLTRAGAVVFFSRGRSLWKTDGTSAGTVLVTSLETDDVRSITHANGQTFLAAEGSLDRSSRVWITDGTAAGTKPLLDSPLRFAIQPVAIGRNVIFAFDTENDLAELWTSDGTSGGTRKIADIPGQSQFFRAAAVDGPRLLFTSLSSGFTNVWESDGSTAGTRVLVSFANADRVTTAVAADRIFFQVSGGSSGLYAMRRGEKPLRLADSSTHRHSLATIGGHLVAGIDDATHGHELWTSDGSVEGTRLLANIAADGATGWVPRRFGENRILFEAFDTPNGHEPWISDGTASGTHILADINPGSDSSYPVKFTDLGNGRALFIATDRASGRELWVTDGTAAGTTRLTDIGPGPRSTFYDFNEGPDLAVLGQRAIFSAASFVGITDGTTAGTHRLADLEAYHGASILIASGFAFIGTTTGLWRTDGTAGGTVQLTPHVDRMHVAGDRLYFTSRTEAEGWELWVTDGSAAGTRLVRDINPGPADAFGGQNGDWFADADGTLLFAADDGVHGSEIWATDGTRDGTRLVRDVNPGPSPSSVREYEPPTASVGSVVLFRANDGEHGTEVWRSDGSPEGTHLLRDIAPGAASSNAGEFVSALGRVYFAADDSTHGQELWSSDGTSAGTSMLSDVQDGPWSSHPRDIIPIGRSLLFFAETEETGVALWRITPPPVHRRAVRR